MKQNITELATKLYFDLPFWKRMRIFYYFDRNNWDVTGNFEKCILVARRMIEHAEYKLKDM